MIRYDKDGITYLLSKKTNTASILTISSDNDVIIIPKVIKRYFTTYNIKSINNNLFLLNKATQIIFEEDSNIDTIGEQTFRRSSIQSIIFPKSLKIISASSFSMCKIQHVDLSKTQLEYLNNEAFSYSSLIDIILPKSIKQIGNRVFFECKSLETIEIPDDSNLNSIGFQAFAFSSLKNLNLPKKIIEIDPTWFFQSPRINLSFSRDFNQSFHWYDDNQTILVQKGMIMFADRKIKRAKIGNDIKHICSYAFNNCANLKEVEFAQYSKLETIGINSFACSSIESISIPESVCGISNQAFYYCNKLKNIEFPDDLKIYTLNYGVLHNTKIRTLKIPKNVYRIEETALADCTDLRSIEYLGCYLTFHPFAFNYFSYVQIFSCPNANYFNFDIDISRKFSNTTIFFFKAPNTAN